MVYVEEKIFDFDLATALNEISPQRRQQALRYKYELGQRTCVLAYLLLKRALREEYGITENPLFEYGEHGKPSILGHPDIHFNLSHCKHAVACVVSAHPVGIDVESIHRYQESLARYTMNEQEMSVILQAERPDVAFTRLWTMKESCVKLSGTGISNNLKDVLTVALQKRYTTVECLQQGYIYSVCEDL